MVREVYQLRSEAHEAMFRSQMVTDDPALVELAEQTLSAVTDLHSAGDRAELDARRAGSKRAISDFVAAATRQVR